MASSSSTPVVSFTAACGVKCSTTGSSITPLRTELRKIPTRSAAADSAGFPDRRNVGPGRWNPIGPMDSVVMDASNPFVGDHTPLIKLAGSEPRGIRQTGIHFSQGVEYKGRIQLAGDTTAKISISIVWGTNADARATDRFARQVEQAITRNSPSRSKPKIPAPLNSKSLAPAPVRSTSAPFRSCPPTIWTACGPMPSLFSRVFAPVFIVSPAAILFPPTNGAMRLAIRTNVRRFMTRFGARSSPTTSAPTSL